MEIKNDTNIPEAFPDSLIMDLRDEPTEKPTTAKPSPTQNPTQWPTQHPTQWPTQHPTQHPTQPPTTPKPKPTPSTTKKPKPKPTPTTTKKPIIVQVLDLMGDDENSTPNPSGNSSMGNGKKCIKLVEEAGYRPEAKTKKAVYRGKIME